MGRTLYRRAKLRRAAGQRAAIHEPYLLDERFEAWVTSKDVVRWLDTERDDPAVTLLDRPLDGGERIVGSAERRVNHTDRHRRYPFGPGSPLQPREQLLRLVTIAELCKCRREVRDGPRVRTADLRCLSQRVESRTGMAAGKEAGAEAAIAFAVCGVERQHALGALDRLGVASRDEQREQLAVRRRRGERVDLDAAPSPFELGFGIALQRVTEREPVVRAHVARIQADGPLELDARCRELPFVKQVDSAERGVCLRQ